MYRSTHLPVHRPLDSLITRVLAFVRAQDASAWLVGGYVRDQLLGRPSYDLDLVVPEGGIRLARAVANAFRGGFFVLDRERDVARAVLRDETGAVLDVDVARLRAPDLLGDLALRDFTVNAIAVEVPGTSDPFDKLRKLRAGASTWLSTGVPGTLSLHVFDPFDGCNDLASGLLRAVTEGAFRDDPLRMLRGVRQAAELGFRIEDATCDWIRRDAPLLPAVSAERVQDELMRIVTAPGAWRHLRTLVALDLLRFSLPEAAALIGVTQSYPHYQDVFDHTRSVLAHTEGMLALLWPEGPYARPEPAADDPTVIVDAGRWDDVARLLAPYAGDLRVHLMRPLASGHTRRDGLFWAVLAHDWGKPAKRSVEPDGRVRFLDHDHVGATLAETRARALAFSADEAAYLRRMTDAHMRPSFLARDYPPTRRALYRFFRDVGDVGPDCALLSLADHLATWAAYSAPEHWQRRLGTMEMILEAYFRQHETRVAPVPLLDGNQIMAEFGLPSGPQIGRLLEGLREAQAAGDVATVGQARAWLAERIGEET